MSNEHMPLDLDGWRILAESRMTKLQKAEEWIEHLMRLIENDKKTIALLGKVLKSLAATAQAAADELE